MGKISDYEQVSITIAGVIFLIGTLHFNPYLLTTISNIDTVTRIGLFTCIAYVLGHIIAGLANMIENNICCIERPNSWDINLSLLDNPNKDKRDFLTEWQILEIRKIFSNRFYNINDKFGCNNNKVWKQNFRIILADIDKNGTMNRINTFNSLYSLHRGVALSILLILLEMFLFTEEINSIVVIALIGSFIVMYHRTKKFGVLHAQEVYNQFIIKSKN